MIPSDVGLWNTGFPMALLALLAVVVPWVLLKKDTRSHGEVAVTIWASAGIMVVLSGVTFAVLYAAQGHEVWDRALQAPFATLWFFMRQAGFATMVWVPILGLVWFGMAQGVEKRRGRDKALRGDAGIGEDANFVSNRHNARQVGNRTGDGGGNDIGGLE